MHEAGGFIIHAHPFLEAHWVESIRLFPSRVDAVEVLNGGGKKINIRAYAYALDYGLRMTGGTDFHSTSVTNFCGVETDSECRTPADLIEAIRSGTARPFSTEQDYILH